MNWSYLAVCLAGAIVLVIEAAQQFRKPVQNMVLDRFSILRGVELEALCTSAERLRGAVFYIGIYLVIYVVILGSADLVDVVVAASGNHAGATGTNILLDQSVNIDGLDFGKPFFISTAIVMALATGVFAPAEKWVRNLAHRASNIPNGVYNVIGRLAQIGYDSLPVREQNGLAAEFEELLSGTGNPQMAVPREDLLQALRIIDTLRPATIGPVRDRLFGIVAMKPLEPFQLLLLDAYTRLKIEQDALDPTDGIALTGFAQRATELSDNMMALFAVQFIRNGRKFISPPGSKRHHDETNFVVIEDEIRENRDASMHSLFGATIACAIGSLIVVPLIYILYLGIVGRAISPDILSAVLNNSAWFAIQSSIMCFFCSYVALLVRDIRRDQGSWDRWELDNPPFMRLVLAVLLPGLIGMIALAAGMLVQDAALARLLTRSQMDAFVRDNWQYLMFFWPLSALIAIGVLFASDQHDNLKSRDTIRMTLMIALPYLVIAIIAVFVGVNNRTGASGLTALLWYVREVLFLLSPVLLFLGSYAWLLERSERAGAAARNQTGREG